jgi:hypothetical protein
MFLVSGSNDLERPYVRGKCRTILTIGKQNHAVVCRRIEFGESIDSLVTIGCFNQQISSQRLTSQRRPKLNSRLL